MSGEAGLSELRAQIDAIDAELVPLFSRRLAVARQIGAVKRKSGKLVLDSAREEAVVACAAARAGAEDAAAVRRLYETILALSRSVQRPDGGLPDEAQGELAEKIARADRP